MFNANGSDTFMTFGAPIQTFEFSYAMREPNDMNISIALALIKLALSTLNVILVRVRLGCYYSINQKLSFTSYV